jgi:hypothetical protein
VAAQLNLVGGTFINAPPRLVASVASRFPGALVGSAAKRCSALDDFLLVHQ